MKIVIEYDERVGRFDLQHDGTPVAALGLLQLAISAIVKKGSREGAPPPSVLQVRKVGS